MIRCLAVVKFSIIIPAGPDRNIEVRESLKKVDYPKNKFEVIVKISLNPSKNRNDGVKEAKGDIIGFLDDDAFVDKNILKNVEAFFDKYKDIDIVGGPQLTPPSDKTFARISGLAMSSFFGAYNMSNRYKKGELNLDADENHLTSANCFLRKKVFKKIDGFNTRLYPGEDPEFFSRAKRSGLKLAYDPSIIIYHKRRPDLKSFFKQFFLYGEARVKLEKINKSGLKPLFLMPALFLVYLVISPILIYINNIFLLPLIAYLIISLISSVYESLRNKYVITIPVLPFFYFIMHISYGLGIISALFKKDR